MTASAAIAVASRWAQRLRHDKPMEAAAANGMRKTDLLKPLACGLLKGFSLLPQTDKRY